MQFLVDKYQCPTEFDIRTWIPKDVSQLQHLLLVGGPSSGKEESTNRLLETLYGDGYKRMKETEYTINNYGSNATKVRLKHSNYHMSITPANSALDKYVIQEVIVDFCRKNDLYFFQSTCPFKCVVIYSADNLSEQAQFCLRRVMETTTRLCRFIMLSSNPCNFILPIRSRFIQINMPTPSLQKVQDFISHVIKEEGITKDDNVNLEVCRDSKEMLWKLESMRFGVPYRCCWKTTVEEIVKHILDNPLKTMRSIAEVREKLGHLFVSNIESDKVILHMMKTMLKSCPSNAALLVEAFARFDCRLRNATRYILHLEALIHALTAIIHHKGETPKFKSVPSLL